MIVSLVQEEIENFGKEVFLVLASRPVYVVSNSNDKFIEEVSVDFKWHSGFAITQKQKSIKELHDSYMKEYGQVKY